VNIVNTVFQDAMLCSKADSYQRLQETCCLHVQSRGVGQVVKNGDMENGRQGLGPRGNWSGVKWMGSPGPERAAFVAGRGKERTNVSSAN
jgi:hypothetical protein